MQQTSSLRQRYWNWRAALDRYARLGRTGNGAFASVVARDWARYAFGVRPVYGETRARARLAADWLCRAQDATPDDGVSYGYFPCDPDRGWQISYPETTGYIIPSLIDFGHFAGDSSLIDRALRMARWEIEIQMPSGAVQGGKLCASEKRTPAAFNTGMVLHGLTAAYRENGATEFLAAGQRAADFLIADMTDEGYFRTNGAFVTKGAIKTYNSLCGWALYRFGQDSRDEKYIAAAVRAAEAAVRKQRANGWIEDNCLTDPDAPLLHTISYTLQGMLEIGALAGRADLIEAACKGAEPLVARLPTSGRLHGRFRNDWSPAVRSSCLTGSAQLAIVLFRLTELKGERHWAEAADRIVDHLKGVQIVDSADLGIDGALAGSFPLFGEYMTAGYPNWATKYFLDALMLQDRYGAAR